MNRLFSYIPNLHILIVLLGVGLLYFPVLNNGFVWDDHYIFFQNPLYRDPNNIFKALTEPLIFQQNYFRPLVVLSFLIQVHLLGLEAWHLHLTNVILHLINTALVMVIVGNVCRLNSPEMQRSWIIPLIAGLFYGLHPVLIEPVAFISSRFDLLMTSFLLAAFLADTRITNRIVRAILVGSLFLLAALCKEMAVAFALVLPLWHFSINPPSFDKEKSYLQASRQRGDFAVYAAIIIAGFTYLGLRYSALGFFVDTSLYSLGVPLDFVGRIAIVGLSVFEYSKLLILPFGNLTPAHDIAFPINIMSAKVLAGFSAIIVLPMLVIFMRKDKKIIVTSITVILFSIIPVINIIPVPRKPDVFFAELFMVFPIALMAMVIARPISLLIGNSLTGSAVARNGSRAIMAAWVLISAGYIITIVPYWNNDSTLWLWAKNRSPHSISVINNLATGYLRSGQYKLAHNEATLAIRLDPNSIQAWNNYALAKMELGDYKRAETAAYRSIELGLVGSYNLVTLGRILYLSKQYEKAQKHFESIVERDGRNLSANIYLALIYAKTGEVGEARKLMTAATEMLPEGPQKRELVSWIDEL